MKLVSKGRHTVAVMLYIAMRSTFKLVLLADIFVTFIIRLRAIRITIIF